MKRVWTWSLAGLVLLLVTGIAARVLMARQSASAEAPAVKPAAMLELSPSDVTTAQRQELVAQLEITGALKAVNSAVVKAKVAAELQALQVREGDRVSAGQVLGRLDASEFALRSRQAQEQAAQARAQLEIAERALENNRALVDQGFISKNALDTSTSNAAAARAALLAAQAATGIAQKAQNDTVLRAPISGIVSQRMAQPGERVGIDAKLFEIVDLSRLEIEAAIAPEDVGKLRLGAQARLKVDGFDAPVLAKVVRINPSTQAGTRAVLVYLAVEPREGLRQGLFAKGSIVLDQRTALAVPESTVRIEQARPYVLVLAEGRVLAKTVDLGRRGTVGTAQEGYAEVLAGVTPGDIVLRATAGTVRDGTAARVVDPASPAPAAAASAAAAR